MAQTLAWTSSLGEAYHNQQADVMAAVQTLRAQAQKAGNLKSGPQITVVQQSSQTIVIQPTNPQIVYVRVQPDRVGCLRAGHAGRCLQYIEAHAACRVGPRTFVTPDDVGAALLTAVKAADHNALLAILGPGSGDLIFSGLSRWIAGNIRSVRPVLRHFFSSLRSKG
jgi:hypothetical protein